MAVPTAAYLSARPRSSLLAARKAWTCWIAIEPSPTAAATRLTDPFRIAGREDARHAGCEMEGRPPEWPSAIVRQVLAGQHESALVSRDIGREPIGVRTRSDQHEEPVCRDGLVGRRAVLAQHEMLEAPVTPAVDDRRWCANFDVGSRPVGSFWRGA